MVRIHPDPPGGSRGASRVGGRGAGEEGAVAQLGERLLCKQEAVGSIPSGSTTSGRCERKGSREGRDKKP